MAIQGTNLGRYCNSIGRNHNLYLTPTGIRIGVRGKVQTATEVFNQYSKSECRRLRKALCKEGRRDFAGAKRTIKSDHDLHIYEPVK